MGENLWTIEMQETLCFVVLNVPAPMIEVGEMFDGFDLAVALLGGPVGAARDGLDRRRFW